MFLCICGGDGWGGVHRVNKMDTTGTFTSLHYRDFQEGRGLRTQLSFSHYYSAAVEAEAKGGKHYSLHYSITLDVSFQLFDTQIPFDTQSMPTMSSRPILAADPPAQCLGCLLQQYLHSQHVKIRCAVHTCKTNTFQHTAPSAERPPL